MNIKKQLQYFLCNPGEFAIYTSQFSNHKFVSLLIFVKVTYRCTTLFSTSSENVFIEIQYDANFPDWQVTEPGI